MTLMNAEPAEAILARTRPTARGAASQSLLRAGIAFATAGLLLVLICGLAYADASASLSVNIVPSGSPPTANFVANFNDVHQVIDGFGGSDAFSGPLPNNVLDEMYCVNATDPGCAQAGIGLTLLRQGVDPGLSVQANALGVIARGGKVWATPWSVDPSDYGSSAQAITNWVSAQIAAGIPIYTVSTQNEPDCGCNGGVVWSTGDTAAFAGVLGPKLHSLSPRVNLSSPEVGGVYAYPNYAAAIEADPTANAQTDIFTFHQYSSPDVIPQVPADGTRRVWEDEIYDSSTWDPSIAMAVNGTSKFIYDAVATFGVNAWHYWWLMEGSMADFGNAGIIATDGVPKHYFAIGNWSRYVRPGWVRIGVSGSLSGLYGVAAFKNPSNGAFAIIAINNSGSDIQNVTFGVSGASVTGSVTPYVTSGTPIGALGSDGNLSAGSASSNVPASLPVSGGVFTSTVPYGVTTFVGQN
jgi:glucuronoarabinoxylan endo-1,4-beta-xylanase